MPLPISSVP
jgi:hypothetical protein